MSSSSDDDVPLSALISKQQQQPQKKKKVENKKKAPAKKKKNPPPPTVDSSSSDDDGVSLAELAKQTAAKKKNKKKTTAVASKKKKPAAKRKKPTAAKKRARAGGAAKKPAAKRAKKKGTSASSSSTEREYKTSIDDFKGGAAGSRKIVMGQDVKLQMALAVLCRWWYVLTWPKDNATNPGPDYVEMAGMPGVYVGVANEVIGNTIDTRNHEDPDKPSIANMMSKSCSELQDLWVRALEVQTVQMSERGDEYRIGSKTKEEFLKLLKAELAHAKSLDPKKLDKVCERQAKKKKKAKR